MEKDAPIIKKRYTTLISIIGFFLIFIFIFFTFFDNPTNKYTVSADNSNFTGQEKSNQVKIFENLNCGTNSTAKSTEYIKELLIPKKCTMPIAITYDKKDNKVWFIGTKEGILFSFDPITKKFESHYIPTWYSRNQPYGNSWSWDIKLDKSMNNIWFTDEKQNSIWKFDKLEKTFHQYKIPSSSKYFLTSYPISIDFDNDNNLYFVGIRTLSIWHGDTTKMKDGTSEGIIEIPIPIKDKFKGIPEYEVGLGSLALDNEKKILWATALAFDKKGVIIQYNITNKEFRIFDLPKNIASPVGISIDQNKDVWITDHDTSSYYKIHPEKISNLLNDSNIEHFVTSPLSTRIFGIDLIQPLNQSYKMIGNTLPYWIRAGYNNSIYFNEHVGNKLARYDPNNDTLIEYWIPTQNKYYSVCNTEQNINCGYSNAMQFDIQEKSPNDSRSNHKLWFTEQSENKIGYVDLNKRLPISLSIYPQNLNISNDDNNKTIEIEMTVVKNNYTQYDNSLNPENKSLVLKPVISGSFTKDGELKNIQNIFSPDILNINFTRDAKESGNDMVHFKAILTILSKIDPGTYNLMVGLESNDFSILKKIGLNVY